MYFFYGSFRCHIPDPDLHLQRLIACNHGRRFVTGYYLMAHRGFSSLQQVVMLTEEFSSDAR